MIERIDVDLDWLSKGVKEFAVDALCTRCTEQMSGNPLQVFFRSQILMRRNVLRVLEPRRQYNVWRAKCPYCDDVELVACSDEAWEKVVDCEE